MFKYSFEIIIVCVIVLIWVLVLSDNKNKEDVKLLKVTTTCRDTLVEIETIKYIPRDETNRHYQSSTIIEYQPDELFKDGKTRDTITKTTTEYY
jgi:hypothetical protein